MDNGVEWTVIYSCDADLQNQKEIFRIVDGDIYCMDRYLYAINTDYNKFFINVIQELFIWQIPVLQKKELIYPIFMAWMNQVTRYI